jgi:hypothetical protein
MTTESFYQSLAGGMHLPYAGHLNFAQILTPRDAAKVAVTYEKDVRDGVHGRWLLCGDVSSKMFSMLRDASPNGVATRLAAFNSSGGEAYAVVSHQVGSFQHRLIVCLYDPPVRQLLSAVCAGEPIGYMLGNQGAHLAVLVVSPHQPVAYAPLLAMARVKPAEAQDRALFELPDVVAAMSDVKQVPSLSREPVKTVCNSLLLPERMRVNLKALLDRVSRV